MRKFVVLLLSVALPVAFAPTAAAFPPQKETTFTEQVEFVVANCQGFKAIEAFTQDVSVTVFFDSAGNPVKFTLHIEGVGTVFNSKTGKSGTDHFAFTVEGDLQAGTEKVVGIVFGVTVPGFGAVLTDAGNVIFDAGGNVIFEGGPHQLLHGDTDELCAALA